MLEKLKKMEMPHVFTLLTIVVFLCSALTYIIPSGKYERESKTVGSMTRTVIVPGSYKTQEKQYSVKGTILGESVEGKASPVSIVNFLSAIPRGMAEAAEIIFFIFIIGGVLGILQETGMIIAILQKLMDIFKHYNAALTIIIMSAIAVGGSTLGMGEEFIPLVPIFLIISKEMGFDRIYGLAIVLVAADVGFAAATTNPFTVNIAQGIAELPLNSELTFRSVFLVTILITSIIYILQYGKKIKKNPASSIMAGDNFDVSDHHLEKVELSRKHIYILISSVLIFIFILYSVQAFGWYLNEMAGGFILMGMAAIIISRIKLSKAVPAFVKGMEEMVVAALVVGFAKGIKVVLEDGQILDTLIYLAANLLQGLPKVIAAQGMLIFQSTLNFFIPSGSGQAAVTMPLMAPLSDILGLSRQTAVFAFTCGDGFSNTLVPTGGVLMAMLSLAKIPYQKWLKFMFPLFIMLMVVSAIFLAISVYIHQ
ncbi:MAG: putative basic amino acid antiporter YfcC [Calditrichaeota bacterium]|nr:MAG: putative basic amino acid antiporter YfcC [Calditrichota bacterium]MBL1204947.1 putative basic amino acid antiporter YfcC [Calditrichota bacterium]NOG44776.1 putative basic amino acid antiporter YfcC [Calditrichota bacterium]